MEDQNLKMPRKKNSEEALARDLFSMAQHSLMRVLQEVSIYFLISWKNFYLHIQLATEPLLRNKHTCFLDDYCV